MSSQPTLFNLDSETVEKTHMMRVFANDEIATALQHLPRAPRIGDYVLFRAYLWNNLPYNSLDTRKRRANYILERFFPNETLEGPLTQFLSSKVNQVTLKPVLFYHLTKAEPILAKVADELIFPNLPGGKVEREQIREFSLTYLPKLKIASQAKLLQAILHSYDLLEVGRLEGETLKFQIHVGIPDAFAYVVSSEYPKPGTYSFQSLFDGPAHRWLLWDKEWIQKQLYILRDKGVISKISEIDSLRQFSIELNQDKFLEKVFGLTKEGNPDEDD